MRDLAADVGGTGAEVVDLDWSADGTLVSLFLGKSAVSGGDVPLDADGIVLRISLR